MINIYIRYLNLGSEFFYVVKDSRLCQMSNDMLCANEVFM